jgi:hypothetical protein
MVARWAVLKAGL